MSDSDRRPCAESVTAGATIRQRKNRSALACLGSPSGRAGTANAVTERVCPAGTGARSGGVLCGGDGSPLCGVVYIIIAHKGSIPPLRPQNYVNLPVRGVFAFGAHMDKSHKSAIKNLTNPFPWRIIGIWISINILIRKKDRYV